MDKLECLILVYECILAGVVGFVLAKLAMM